MGGKQVGSKNRAKQRRRRRLGILPLTPLRQIQSAFAEKYPSLPFLSFAFIYAWVCMTFPAGEWANWQNLDSSTIKLLPVFSNVPALIVFGAVILAAEQWNRWLDSPPFLLGSGLAGSIGCILMMTAPFSEEKDVLFLVGCMVADFGTAPLTIALARIFARRGPRTTLTFVLLFMVVGIAIWYICLSIPVDYARTIYVLLPLAASLPLLASPKNSLYSCADKTTGETPPSLGSILRFTAVFAFFTLLASFAMSLSGGGIHLRSSYEIAFFWAIVLASCLAVMSLAWFRYKTVERLYYTLALCEVAILVLTAFIGYDEITTFVFIAVLNTLFDAISWSVKRCRLLGDHEAAANCSDWTFRLPAGQCHRLGNRPVRRVIPGTLVESSIVLWHWGPSAHYRLHLCVHQPQPLRFGFLLAGKHRPRPVRA